LAVLFVQLAAGSAKAADACPNAAIRAEQGTQGLPECRAYEMVSPPDKNSSDVANTASRVQSDPDGTRITYISSGAFAGAPGTGAVAQYLSTRGADGWATRAINPYQQSNGFSFFKNSGFKLFNSGLTRGVFVGGSPALDPAAPAGVRNLYAYDIPTGAFSVLTTKGTNPLFGMFPEPYFAAATDDYSHVLFESTAAITPDAPDDGNYKLYESINGVPEFVGLLPGDVPAAGSVAGNGANQGPIQASNNYTGHTLSADGSRVIFKDVETGQLYSRVDGTTTIHVSASQRTDCSTSPGSCSGTPEPDPAGPQPATFRDASADGKRIFFTSCEKLTDDASGECEFGAQYLYEYDADSGHLALVSADLEPADGAGGSVTGTLGVSKDGSVVYFAAMGRLTADTPSEGDRPFLYGWDGDTVRFVAHLSGSDESNGALIGISYQAGLQGRVTSDGRHALFVSAGSQPGIDNHGLPQIYLYDAGSGILRCLSCGGEGGSQALYTTLAQVAPGVPAGKNEYRNRALLADGSKAFFSTPAALVPADHNGMFDAYEWDSATETLSLISGGRAAVNSYFVEASADGNEVFFTTRERLLNRDQDNSVDLYVASSGGGFMEPSMEGTRCRGERCQGESAAPGGEPAAGSELVQGDAPAPEARLRVARSIVLRGTSGRVKVKTSATGTLRATGRLLVPSRKSVPKAGRQSLLIRLTAAGRRKLARSGSLSVVSRLVFTPTEGPKQVAKVTVKFTKESK